MTSDRSVSRCVINNRVCLDGLCEHQNVCFKFLFDNMSPYEFVNHLVENPADSASVFHYLSVSSAVRTNNIFEAAEVHPYFSKANDKSHGKPTSSILTFPYEFFTRIIVDM